LVAKKIPATTAVRVLREADAEYSEHLFDYERYPGAEGAAAALGIDLHSTAKTIVFTTDSGDGLLVLMHGDREVSTKKAARALSVKSVRPATQREADRFTGYQFGGTSPLGTRTKLPVLAQETLADLGTVYVNAGSRGFLIGIAPDTLFALSGAQLVDVAVD
jgi:Cys-tRNA(Pro) deacylase